MPRSLSEEAKYQMDRERYEYGCDHHAGVTVTARDPEGDSSIVDIGMLDRKSLGRFLRSRGGNNELAEDIVKKMLGHDISKPEEE